MPYNLKVLPRFLPKGEEDAASLVVGQRERMPFTVKVWKEGSLAFCNLGNPRKSAKIVDEEEVMLHITDTG